MLTNVHVTLVKKTTKKSIQKGIFLTF